MAKSVQIPDSLHEMAAVNAALMQRALAEQAEYWASRGKASDKTGDRSQVIAELIKQNHLLNDIKVARGENDPESLFFISRERAKKMRVVWSASSLQDFVL